MTWQCPTCGEENQNTVSLNGATAIVDGDVAVCGVCANLGRFMVVPVQMIGVVDPPPVISVRLLTPREHAVAGADRQVRAAQLAVRQRVGRARARWN